ncbi:MAG: hypothetical protein AAFS10_04875 [Myxococcota bacterium]
MKTATQKLSAQSSTTSTKAATSKPKPKRRRRRKRRRNPPVPRGMARPSKKIDHPDQLDFFDYMTAQLGYDPFDAQEH